MSFKIENKNKAVCEHTVTYKNGETVTFKIRKPSTREILDLELDTSDFMIAYNELFRNLGPLYKRFQAKQDVDIDSLSDEEQEALHIELADITSDIKKLSIFSDPASIESVKEQLRIFILTSNGIEVDGVNVSFHDLPEESQAYVLDEIPFDQLKSFIEAIKMSVSLSPLE